MSSLRSDLVVISWWSNCLGLTCLHRLSQYLPGRSLYVIQAGKTAEQQERFRVRLPEGVLELAYPADRPGEDWRVREAVARELLADRAGLWFVDHDLFLQEDAEGWFEEMDWRLARGAACLCHPMPRRGPSITNPAFWLSPVRFPPGLPGFARLPYHEEPVASRPFALRQPAGLMMPEKDTLVAAMEHLLPLGQVDGFPLTDRDRWPGSPPPWPRSEHLGGLYTFTGDLPAGPLRAWAARSVEQFTAFFAACPPEWLADEDPVLLDRIEQFRAGLTRAEAAA